MNYTTFKKADDANLRINNRNIMGQTIETNDPELEDFIGDEVSAIGIGQQFEDSITFEPGPNQTLIIKYNNYKTVLAL